MGLAQCHIPEFNGYDLKMDMFWRATRMIPPNPIHSARIYGKLMWGKPWEKDA